MSLSPPVLAEGLYNIYNEHYSHQVATLISPQDYTSVIGGQTFNSTAKNMQWLLEIQSEGEYKFTNQEIDTFAFASFDNFPPEVVGNPSVSTFWNLKAVDTEVDDGYFLISATTGDYIWTLSDAKDGTPITLNSTSSSEKDPHQVWHFVAVA